MYHLGRLLTITFLVGLAQYVFIAYFYVSFEQFASPGLVYTSYLRGILLAQVALLLGQVWIYVTITPINYPLSSFRKVGFAGIAR